MIIFFMLNKLWGIRGPCIDGVRDLTIKHNEGSLKWKVVTRIISLLLHVVPALVSLTVTKGWILVILSYTPFRT